ncbi:hypothetical protein GF337_16265, partial [candidate division KSB1 bacterium]|nr:hypothetical protein [candidate division KSB1 bacterium]
MLIGTQIQLFSKFVFFSIIAISLMLFSVCEKRHAELMTPFGNAFLGAPQNLNATTGDNLVTLTWTVTSDSGVAVYFIYRRDSMQQQPSFLDSSATKEYTDENVVNGNLYFYQVSAVDSAGYEGERSAEIRVRPSVYDIIIEDGKKYTNNQTVTLKLTADLNTHYMMIANDSTFTDAAWEVFAPVKSWTLTPNDGEKHVYGKFRDSEGNINRYPAHSKIELDTRASIDSISENTAGAVMAPGQVIHFKLDAGEPNGKATIDIGNQKFNIRLYDDGDNGDAVALDGIYELDYTIPSGMEMMNGIVTGHFTDRAGNVADDVTAPGRVSIQLDPGAVTLFLSVQSGSSTPAIELYWSESDDPDFASYRLFRSATAGVDTSSKL